jgi:hypothetical protein
MSTHCLFIIDDANNPRRRNIGAIIIVHNIEVIVAIVRNILLFKLPNFVSVNVAIINPISNISNKLTDSNFDNCFSSTDIIYSLFLDVKGICEVGYAIIRALIVGVNKRGFFTVHRHSIGLSAIG